MSSKLWMSHRPGRIEGPGSSLVTTPALCLRTGHLGARVPDVRRSAS
ncbi:hypothetical protein [Streptomyces sp. LN245]